MRSLAIARYRMLTTIRSAMPMFVIAIFPPIMVSIAESLPAPAFRVAVDGRMLSFFASISMVGWFFHAAVLLMTAETSGAKFFALDTQPASDLMDSAPAGAATRFWGETMGVFAATLLLHVSCLPVLAVVAALSPLPTIVFVYIEVMILVLLVLSSATAAWKRMAPRTKFAATRSVRAGILFLILLIASLRSATQWDAFREASFALHNLPSATEWHRVVNAVDNPLLLGVLLTLLYGGYLSFYYYQSTRDREPA